MFRLSFIISFVIFMATFSYAQQADEIIGKYHLPNDLDVEIFENNGKYFWKIIAINDFENEQTKNINKRVESV